MAIINVPGALPPHARSAASPGSWERMAEALGYKDTVNALKRHIDEEDKLWWQFTTSGQRVAA